MRLVCSVLSRTECCVSASLPPCHHGSRRSQRNRFNRMQHAPCHACVNLELAFSGNRKSFPANRNVQAVYLHGQPCCNEFRAAIGTSTHHTCDRTWLAVAKPTYSPCTPLYPATQQMRQPFLAWHDTTSTDAALITRLCTLASSQPCT